MGQNETHGGEFREQQPTSPQYPLGLPIKLNMTTALGEYRRTKFNQSDPYDRYAVKSA